MLQSADGQAQNVPRNPGVRISGLDILIYMYFCTFSLHLWILLMGKFIMLCTVPSFSQF